MGKIGCGITCNLKREHLKHTHKNTVFRDDGVRVYYFILSDIFRSETSNGIKERRNPTSLTDLKALLQTQIKPHRGLQNYQNKDALLTAL